VKGQPQFMSNGRKKGWQQGKPAEGVAKRFVCGDKGKKKWGGQKGKKNKGEMCVGDPEGGKNLFEWVSRKRSGTGKGDGGNRDWPKKKKTYRDPPTS